MEKINNDGYKSLLEELKKIIENGQHQAYKTVDNIKVQTYWQIGERVVREELKFKERADYGKYLINNLAIDLNVERKLMYKIVKFYKLYPIVPTLSRQSPIVATLSPQLSWSHYVELIELNNSRERQFYEQKIIYNSWSIRELRKQIKNKLYQNTNQKEVTTISKTTPITTTDIQKLFKSEYNLNFLTISPNHQESVKNYSIKKAQLNLAGLFL